MTIDLSGFVEFLRPFEAAGATISYEFSDFNTEVQGPVAWMRYRNRAVLEMNGERTRHEWLESARVTDEASAEGVITNTGRWVLVSEYQPDGALKIRLHQNTWTN